MLDPIQMGLRIIRLGYSRFKIEHRSYQFVRLQGTNVIQIFLFAFCDRASVLLTRSSSRNHCDPGFSVRVLRSSIQQPIMRIEDRLFDRGWVRSAMATRKCGNIYFRKYFMAVRKFTNIFVLLLILMVGSRDTLFLVCFT